MFRRIKTIFLILIILVTCLTSSGIALGEGEEVVNAEIKDLNSEIQDKKDNLERLKKQQDEYSKLISEKQQDRASLVNQLSILDNRLAKAELDIESANLEIDQVNLEIRKVTIEIEEQTEKIAEEKGHIANILKLLYKQEQADSLEIILLNNSLVDFLNQIKYLEDVNGAIGDSLDNLQKMQNELERDKANLDRKNSELADLKEELEANKLALENERETKELVLEQVRSSEYEYQGLLARARQEQANAASEIATLEKTVREKLENVGDEKLEFNDAGLIWPVPKNTITSTFHDPDYPFRYIFEHPAIDIRAGQGTTLKSAASGYVARVKIEGTSYGYIMIIHGDGLSTVYGHASKAYVAEDEYVVQGQTIGLSGGMPGTPGSGNLTTGPHLHFEVRLNGIPVNPLEYLP